jgi:hypothetical protein
MKMRRPAPALKRDKGPTKIRTVRPGFEDAEDMARFERRYSRWYGKGPNPDDRWRI